MSPSVTFPFISTVWCFRPYKPYIFWKLIIWWWHWLRRRLTKRQIQRQRHPDTDKDKYKDPIYAIFSISRGFKDLQYYWLSSCNDTDTDKTPIFYALLGVNIFRYFSRVNIFKGGTFFRGEYFSEVNISKGWIFFMCEYFSRWIFFRGEYFSGVNMSQRWIYLRGEYF